MDSTSIAISCAALGGGLELAGLLTVVYGIREDRRQARALLDPQPRPRPKPPPAPPRASASQLRQGHTMGGLRSASVESVARRQYESEAALVNALGKIATQTSEGLQQLGENLRDEMEARDAELRARLRYLLDESAGARAAGVLLLSVGIIFAVAGSVIGAAA